MIPKLPADDPGWLQSFDRLMVSPLNNDIAFLLDTSKKSRYASMIKVAKSVDSIPATVQKGDPYALPIEPQY